MDVSCDGPTVQHEPILSEALANGASPDRYLHACLVSLSDDDLDSDLTKLLDAKRASARTAALRHLAVARVSDPIAEIAVPVGYVELVQASAADETVARIEDSELVRYAG
jgi:hypothetical protein